MDVNNTPETYIPNMDVNTKQYYDHCILSFVNGVICPCTNNKIFLKKESFQNHRKTKRHHTWIEHLNTNAINFYKETLDQQKIIRSQQILLTEMEIKLKQKETIINYLERKHANTNTNTNSSVNANANTNVNRCDIINDDFIKFD
jgi:hypothetical protein